MDNDNRRLIKSFLELFTLGSWIIQAGLGYQSRRRLDLDSFGKYSMLLFCQLSFLLLHLKLQLVICSNFHSSSIYLSKRYTCINKKWIDFKLGTPPTQRKPGFLVLIPSCLDASLLWKLDSRSLLRFSTSEVNFFMTGLSTEVVVLCLSYWSSLDTA